LARDLASAEREMSGIRMQRLAMAAAVAGLRAELAMLQGGGPEDLTEITQKRLAEVLAQLETFDRDVFVPAEARRQTAQDRASRFEAFFDRVIAA
jgi:hypothetical protein